ncbi:MAG: hypothetical protein AB1420_13510 [Bacillota bacterium]
MRSHKWTGIVLVLVGCFLLLANLKIIDGMYFLLLLGTAFIAVYYAVGRNIGFLIPGCILTAIGLFTVLNSKGFVGQGFEGSFLVFLGLAFIAVLFVHTMHAETRNWGERFWPVFPGGALIFVGLTVTGIKKWGWPNFWQYFNYIWPLFLIVAGLVLYFRNKY